MIKITDLDIGFNDEEEYIFLNKDIDFKYKYLVKGQIIFIKNKIDGNEMFLIDENHKIIFNFYRMIKFKRLF